jgi:hypothetical protein
VQTLLLPQQAVVSAAGRTDEEMVREEPPPHEIAAIAQEEALAADDEVAAVAPGAVAQEMPASLALEGTGEASHGGDPRRLWPRRAAICWQGEVLRARRTLLWRSLPWVTRWRMQRGEMSLRPCPPCR